MYTFLSQLIDQVNYVNHHEDAGTVLKFREKECREYLDSIDPNWLIRTNPSCKCSDEQCPHKSHINLMGLFMVYDKIRRYTKILDFHPEKIQFDNVFYQRKKVQITINEYYEIPHCYDIFEGIEFEDTNVNGLIVEFSTNGTRDKFTIENNRLFKIGNYIPVLSCVYTHLSLLFPNNIKCNLIFGDFAISHTDMFCDGQIFILDDTRYILISNMLLKEQSN